MILVLISKISALVICVPDNANVAGFLLFEALKIRWLFMTFHLFNIFSGSVIKCMFVSLPAVADSSVIFSNYLSFCLLVFRKHIAFP